jgi:hypothetical protein
MSARSVASARARSSAWMCTRAAAKSGRFFPLSAISMGVLLPGRFGKDSMAATAAATGGRAPPTADEMDDVDVAAAADAALGSESATDSVLSAAAVVDAGASGLALADATVSTCRACTATCGRITIRTARGDFSFLFFC